MLKFFNAQVYKLNRWKLVRQGMYQSQHQLIEKMEEPIDFVITWVDGSDSSWLAEKEYYAQKIGISKEYKDNGDERYRDWDLLRYWFRSVEKYAPWVRNIYFVTCGQIPDWMNCNAPKLKLVNHADFIPYEYLPTFNCNPIELNYHRIETLGEYVVNFNDDVFLTKPVCPEDFFRGNMPNYSAIAKPLKNEFYNGAFQHMQFSILGILNGYFTNKVSKTIREHPAKWFTAKYGPYVKYNIQAFDEDYLSGMYFPHLAVPFRKSTLCKIWKEIPRQMHETSTHRFRTPQDIIHQIISLWDMMEGNFQPVSYEHWGKVFALPGEQKDEICDAIRNRKYRMICINDSENVSHEDYLELKQHLQQVMQETFSEKSMFEK